MRALLVLIPLVLVGARPQIAAAAPSGRLTFAATSEEPQLGAPLQVVTASSAGDPLYAVVGLPESLSNVKQGGVTTYTVVTQIGRCTDNKPIDGTTRAGARMLTAHRFSIAVVRGAVPDETADLVADSCEPAIAEAINAGKPEIAVRVRVEARGWFTQTVAENDITVTLGPTAKARVVDLVARREAAAMQRHLPEASTDPNVKKLERNAAAVLREYIRRNDSTEFHPVLLRMPLQSLASTHYVTALVGFERPDGTCATAPVTFDAFHWLHHPSLWAEADDSSLPVEVHAFPRPETLAPIACERIHEAAAPSARPLKGAARGT